LPRLFSAQFVALLLGVGDEWPVTAGAALDLDDGAADAATDPLLAGPVSSDNGPEGNIQRHETLAFDFLAGYVTLC
jgi:hypothetical protein